MPIDSYKNTQEELFKIEDAKLEDVVITRTIIKNNWVAIYSNEKYGITIKDITDIDFYDPELLAKRRKEIIENGDIHTFVLKNSKNEVAGFCKLSKHDTYGEIDAMHLIPQFQRKGFGKVLMQKAIEWLGSDKDIKLKVVSYNFNAIKFYKKSGFQETTNKVDYEGTKLPSGKELPRIEMIKPRIVKENL